MATAGKTMSVLILLALGVGLGGAAYNHFVLNAESVEGAPIEVAARDDTVELAEIEVTTVERTDIAEEIRISGVINPVRHTRLDAEVGGTVAEVHARVGEEVEAGDVLVELETDRLEATLAAREASLTATQAQLTLAQSTLERNRQLGQSGITSEAALLEAEANVLNLEAQVQALEAEAEQARLQLADAVIRAPFDGVISARSVEPGQAVAVNVELFQLVDLSRLEVAVAVPTSRIAQVRLGQTAQIAVDGLGGEDFEAVVARISPVAETGTRAVRVFLQMDNADERLRGGMFATGTLRTQEFPGVIALPQSALRSDAGGDFVLKAEDGRLVRQSIEQGIIWSDRGLVEVAEGLEDGDVVVTAPLPDLQPDVDVRIAEI